MDGLRKLSLRKSNEPFHDDTHEDTVLEKFGYQQELNRSFGLLGMIGFAFSIITCWTALTGVLTVGIYAGGPPVIVYSWLGVCLVTLAVAYSFAEMCSAYPVAGGQYSWVALMAPPKFARGLSWVCGWFMITGIVSMGAVNNFLGANLILGMANLTHPEYTIKREHTVLLCYLITVVAVVCNIWGQKVLSKISKVILCWNILSFLVIVITMLTCNDHKQPASFVFKDFQNGTGFSSGMAVIIGLLQSCFGMCCYDAPAHMTEEMKNASREAPKAIIMSVYLGAVTGFIFLVSAFFCIGDFEATAFTPTGVPMIEIFHNSTGSIAGTCVLASMIGVIMLVCANSLMAEGSRALFAFARDHGLPFSSVFSQVDKHKQVPVNSIFLCAGAQVAFNSIYFGTYTGFSSVISIATEGFYMSYAIPLFARILGRISGHEKPLTGPYSLGRWGIWFNLVGLIFLVFASVTFNFPSIAPVTKDNMNYCSASVGVIALVSLLTWIFDGRKNFTGPQTDIVVDNKESFGIEG